MIADIFREVKEDTSKYRDKTLLYLKIKNGEENIYIGLAKLRVGYVTFEYNSENKEYSSEIYFGNNKEEASENYYMNR